jgi:hypothetical protein
MDVQIPSDVLDNLTGHGRQVVHDALEFLNHIRVSALVGEHEHGLLPTNCCAYYRGLAETLKIHMRAVSVMITAPSIPKSERVWTVVQPDHEVLKMLRRELKRVGRAIIWAIRTEQWMESAGFSPQGF